MKAVHCQSRCLPRCLLSTYNVRKEMQVHTYSHAVQTCIQCLMASSVSLRKLPPDHAPELGNPSSAWHQLRTQLLQRICLASGGYRAPCDSIHDYGKCERILEEPGRRNLCLLHVRARRSCRSKSRNGHCGTKGKPWDVLECDSQSEL